MVNRGYVGSQMSIHHQSLTLNNKKRVEKKYYKNNKLFLELYGGLGFSVLLKGLQFCLEKLH